MKFNEKLRSLIGNDYLHLGHKIRIADVNIDGDVATVITDTSRQYKLEGEKKIKSFLDGLLLVPHKEEPNGSAVATMNGADNQQLKEFNQTLDEMVKVMLRTIENTEKNPGYVAQASQINKSVTQIINTAKLKVEAARLVDKRKRRVSRDDDDF